MHQQNIIHALLISIPIMNLISSNARSLILSPSLSVNILPGDDSLLPSEALKCSTRYSVTELAKANGLTFILVITIPNVYSDGGIWNPLRGVVSQHICCMPPGGGQYIYCPVV